MEDVREKRSLPLPVDLLFAILLIIAIVCGVMFVFETKYLAQLNSVLVTTNFTAIHTTMPSIQVQHINTSNPFTPNPSKKPTTKPSKKPTTKPSKKPTIQPSKRPTKSPTHSLSPTTGNPLPGIILMAKAYNVLSATPIGSDGRDVISYHWNNILTNRISDTAPPYEIPMEISDTPNIDPSCKSQTAIHEVMYSASTAVLSEQSKASSLSLGVDLSLGLGFDIGDLIELIPELMFVDIDEEGPSLGIEPSVDIGVTLSNAVTFGSSTTSIQGIQQSQNGYSWSFSLDTSATFYSTGIDWLSSEHDFQFKWKVSLQADIAKLNLSPTNQSIFLFFTSWGTHVLSKMRTGAHCTKTVYASSDSSFTQVSNLQHAVKSYNILVWGHSSSSESKHFGEFDNETKYEVSDVDCDGQVQVTSLCGGLTGTFNTPVATAFDILPIWKVYDIKENMTAVTVQNIDSFWKYLLLSLNTCSTQYCSSRGTCTLNQDRLQDGYSWNGVDFSFFWDVNGMRGYHCFCNEGYFRNDCSSNTETKSVFGGIYGSYTTDTAHHVIVDVNNPYSGGKNCPTALYEAVNLNYYDGDTFIYSLFYCLHTNFIHSSTDGRQYFYDPLNSFGGIFRIQATVNTYKQTLCRSTNPFTGACSCPDGYGEYYFIIGGGEYHVEIALYCWNAKDYFNGAKPPFAGAFQTGHFDISNPATLTNSCPSGYTPEPLMDNWICDNFGFKNGINPRHCHNHYCHI